MPQALLSAPAIQKSPRGTKSIVAVVRTTPETVLEDVGRAMKLAEYERFLPRRHETILKINISWHHWMPACSTTPWQMDGVIRRMKKDGYRGFLPAQNRTVVVDPKEGATNNHHVSVMERHGLRFRYLYEGGEEWVVYQPRARMLVLDRVFPRGITIPRLFIGKNALHLPTVKTHVFTGTTGAMKNAFGGLLQENRHWTHAVIHETLVDLLNIQKEIHPGLFAVMDGTFVGNGPGPRAMVPEVKNYLLASADQVAIDAVAARMMGFDPLSLKYIRLAHDQGLGCGDVSRVRIVGEDISGVDWGFHVGETLASRGQRLIYHGLLKPFEHLLLRTWLVPWSFAASRLYHDAYWYPFVGRPRVRRMMETGWGRLLLDYRSDATCLPHADACETCRMAQRWGLR